MDSEKFSLGEDSRGKQNEGRNEISKLLTKNGRKKT